MNRHAWNLGSIQFLAWVVMLVAWPAFATRSHAAVFAGFTDGNGTTLPDQYAGTAGDGWVTPWQDQNGFSGHSSFAASVTATNPLAGGGNYLSGSFGGTGFVVADHLLMRTYGEGGSTGIDYASPQTLSWRFRIDAANDFNFTGLNDNVQFHDQDPNNFDDAGKNWWIWLTDADERGVVQWQFLVNSGNFNFFLPTHVLYVPGDVYEFTVKLHGANTFLWDGTVTNLDWDPADGGIPTFTQTNITSSAAQARGVFSLNVDMQDFEDGSETGSIDFSLDSLRVVGQENAQVPEPLSLITWCGFLALNLTAFSYRTRRQKSPHV